MAFVAIALVLVAVLGAAVIANKANPGSLVLLAVPGALLLLLGLTPTSVSATRYRDPSFADITTKHRVVYGQVKHRDGSVHQLRLDLYKPRGDVAARRRAMIWVHGGAFIGGDRTHMASFAADAAMRGYVSATITYRLSSTISRQAILNAQHDAQAAVRWFRRHARRLRIAPSRIFVGGVSAGAITALRVAYNATDPGRSGNRKFSSRVAGAVSISGAVYDQTLLRANGAPVLYLHGREDTTVPYNVARRDCRAARRRGLKCAFKGYAGVGHELVSRQDAILDAAARWLYPRG